MQLRSYRAVTEKTAVYIIVVMDHFLAAKTPTFKTRPRAKPFFVKMSFICMRIKNHFHIKWNGFLLKFAMKQRLSNSEMAY